MACQHLKFGAHVDVHRLEDTGGFMADVRIKCVECDQPFSFLGLPAGLSFERPMVSLDGCELHVPLEPGAQPIGASGSLRFEMPVRSKRN